MGDAESTQRHRKSAGECTCVSEDIAYRISTPSRLHELLDRLLHLLVDLRRPVPVRQVGLARGAGPVGLAGAQRPAPSLRPSERRGRVKAAAKPSERHEGITWNDREPCQHSLKSVAKRTSEP